MGPVTIASVVEGAGEVTALPVLLRRIAERHEVWSLRVPRPYLMARSKIVRPGGIEAAVEAVARQVDGPGGVLVLFDADDDLPCVVGPELLERARRTRADVEVGVVAARSEFESWFLAAAPSLAGCRDLPDPLVAPERPEGLRDAKGWLSHRMAGHPYKPTVDQAALAQRFDLDLARAGSPSFDKLWRDVTRLLGANRRPRADSGR